MTYRSQKLLDACRELPCQLCGAEDGTVVGAHMNEGKGTGHKTRDSLVWAACYACHAEYDQGRKMTRDEKRELAWRMVAKTYAYMLEHGIVRLK